MAGGGLGCLSGVGHIGLGFPRNVCVYSVDKQKEDTLWRSIWVPAGVTGELGGTWESVQKSVYSQFFCQVFANEMHHFSFDISNLK